MRATILLSGLGLLVIALTPWAAAQAPCANVDLSTPHFYTGAPPGATSAAFVPPRVFSTNGVPTGCDVAGSDGDNEQGVGGAQMPLIGATCPYAQGPTTVGHHMGVGIWADNVGAIDVRWVSGTDGYDALADLAGVGSCVGNGVITDNPLTDPADCMSNVGTNANLLANVHHPASLTTTNDPASGWSCLDAVDGNVWTALLVEPLHLDLCLGRIVSSQPISGIIVDGFAASPSSC